MPVKMVTHYNKIDVGIFLLFLELCLEKNSIKYKRQIFIDNNEEEEKTLIAEYLI